MKQATAIKAIRNPLIEQTLQFTDQQMGWFCFGFEKLTTELLNKLEPIGDSEFKSQDKLIAGLIEGKGEVEPPTYCARVIDDNFLYATLVRNHLISQGIDAALAYDQHDQESDWYVLTYEKPPFILCDFSIQ